MSAQKIVQLLGKNGALSIHEIAENLQLSRQYLHRILLELQENNKVIKLGKAPFVYYQVQQINIPKVILNNLTSDDLAFLQTHFLIITETGVKLDGIDAITHWCNKQKLPIEKTAIEYITTRKKYLQYYNDYHVIDGTQKLKDTKDYATIYCKQLLYLDFYAIERFGKTRLGTLMHFAKQGQNKRMMAQIVAEIKNRVYQLIKDYNIDAILFVPPTIKREVQIMTYLKKHLQIQLPEVGIKKINNEIIIPQKALSKLYERITNAQMTFVITDSKKYKRILIIDDAVGSGATINEIAGKLLQKGTAKEIVGLAITGSYKGFDVITEL